MGAFLLIPRNTSRKMEFGVATSRVAGAFRRVTLPFLLVPLAFLFVCSAAAENSGPDVYGITAPSIASSLPDRGDPSGVRKELTEYGITAVFNYTNDVLANVDGGLKRGVIDQGLLEARLTVDLDKAIGWNGLSLFANAFQIHNTGRMLRDYVGGINTIAAIEAVPTTRLSELWLEQSFDNGKGSLRVGQLAADTEFFFSDLSVMFLQSDWATIVAKDLPSGGAAYPLSTPGVRLKYAPDAETSFFFAVLNGDPAGPGPGNPELRDRYGLNFRVTDPPFVIGEVQLRNDPSTATLNHTYKFGAWGHFGSFADRRFASDGTLLANPDGSGNPEGHRGNGGVYAVIDQQIYRSIGGAKDSGVAVYSRISASPSDRNPIDFYVDGGLVVSGMVPQHPDDKFGVGFIYSKYSDQVSDFDQDRAALTNTPFAVQDFEANIEFDYLHQIIDGWTVQPDLQYVWHPSGNPDRHAVVVGMRTALSY